MPSIEDISGSSIRTPPKRRKSSMDWSARSVAPELCDSEEPDGLQTHPREGQLELSKQARTRSPGLRHEHGAEGHRLAFFSYGDHAAEVKRAAPCC